MGETVFLRLLSDRDKDIALIRHLHAIQHAERSSAVHIVAVYAFSKVSGSPFSYWVADATRQLFADLPPLNSHDRDVKVGASTKSDFRFLRTWWEVEPRLEARS